MKINYIIPLLTFVLLWQPLKTQAQDYRLEEQFYNSGQYRILRVHHSNICAVPNPDWVSGSFSRQYRLTFQKAGIASGFGKVVQYRHLGNNTLDAGNYIPLVVGERYQLSVDYYGQALTTGGSCVGANQVRSMGTKEFRYDVHDTVLTFPVDINMHSRMLRHRDTNKCLYPELNGATAFDSMVRATTCDDGEDLAFEVIDAETGVQNEVRIRSQLTKQCLSPRRYTTINGAGVRLSSCLDDKKTIFILDPVVEGNQVAPGFYYLKHKATSSCIYNYGPSSNAHLWGCWDSSNQVFEIESF